MTADAAAKKSLGQHWLSDKSSLTAICEAAHINSSDLVLEIGPGTGNLTKVLLDTGAEVFALEYDISLVEQLSNKFPAQTSLSIEHGDIRQFNFERLPSGYKIVANIPYYLTANLLRALTDTSNKPAVAVILVQKEVAERVAAAPGKMSFISVAAQVYYEVSLGLVVPARLFTPPPEVDSQVLILKSRAQSMFGDDTKQFFRLAKAGFANRRKTLLNSLSAGLQLDKSAVEKLLTKADIPPQTRPQELSLSDWRKLYHELKA